ncbi:uncharacterized protein J3D65DRAFT_664791 [Phyllosticta citribraziliensis]|uniref:Uncharacterized protein n=1 Tax=Phyllosticta citribraziliensis TaxID=989973 RepID=A0ABR1M499_9PEZI
MPSDFPELIESEEAAIDEEVVDERPDIARDLAEQVLLHSDLDLYSRARYEALLIVLPGGGPRYHFTNALHAVNAIDEAVQSEREDPHPNDTKVITEMRAFLDIVKWSFKALSARRSANTVAKSTPETGDTSGAANKGLENGQMTIDRYFKPVQVLEARQTTLHQFFKPAKGD